MYHIFRFWIGCFIFLFSIFPVFAETGDTVNEIFPLQGTGEEMSTPSDSYENATGATLDIEDTPNTGVEYTNTGGLEDVLDSSGTVFGYVPIISDIPPLVIDFQSPSYLFPLIENTYVCDSLKEECKINFDLRSTFGGYVPTKYVCEINFGFMSPESSKCNPNTLIFPEGDYAVYFKIYEKDNPLNFQEKTIFISNKKTHIVPPIPKLTVQSGLSFLSETSFLCKTEECPVNLSAEESFSPEFPESRFLCSWDFGVGTYETLGTAEKCNPGYVRFPFGIHEVSLFIQEDGNIQNKTQFTFQVQNTFEKVNISDIDSSLLKDIHISFQSPSYLFSASDNTYTCDSSKDGCKVNFDLRDTFGGYVPTKYACNIDFSFPTGEENKCNPNTVSFPEGIFSVRFKIYEKDNPNIFQEKSIIINNLFSVEKNQELAGEELAIIIQSGLTKNANGAYECSEEKCRINLSFVKKGNPVCKWDFGNLDYKEKYTQTCNPAIIYADFGKHIVSVVVDDRYYSLEFTNTYLEKMKENNTPPVAKISLQGKLGKNKKMEGTKIICFDSDECSINFSGEESYDIEKNNISFFWNFGDGETFIGKNPKSKKFLPGKYLVSLTVSDDLSSVTDSISLEVLLPGQIESKYLNAFVFKNLRISGVSANPVGIDSDEWVELKNMSFIPLPLKGVEIDDEIGKGSKKFVIEEDIWLGAYEKKKFYKYDTALNLGNTVDEVHLFYNLTEIDSLSWDFPVPENYIITHDIRSSVSNKVHVKSVIDGDTIVIVFPGGVEEKLRFLGVDTPETKHPKKKIEYFGLEAYKFTKQMLEGKDVYLQIDKQNYRDKYGRLLGYIYIEDGEEKIFFNRLSVELGYARAYLVFPFQYSAEFKKVEDLAKKNKLGMWSDKEMKKELLVIQKAEEGLILENQAFVGDITFLEKVFQHFFDVGVHDVAVNFEQNFFSKVLASVHTWQSGKKVESAVIQINKPEQNTVVQKSFYINVSLLKSGLKFSGKTLPLKKIHIHYEDFIFEAESDINGIFSFLQTDGLSVGEYDAFFVLENLDGVQMLLTKEKHFILSPEYISEYQMKLASDAKKSLESSKKKKTKKKTVKKLKVAQIKKVKPLLVTLMSPRERVFIDTPVQKWSMTLGYFLLIFLGFGFYYYFLLQSCFRLQVSLIDSEITK